MRPKLPPRVTRARGSSPPTSTSSTGSSRRASTYDVFTDEDLHPGAPDLPRAATGSCSPGATRSTGRGRCSTRLEATSRGGRLIYLGGNGFYWVTRSTRSARRDRGPTRDAGTRTLGLPLRASPAASTGELGGIWRHRGRPPNRLVGVGFTGQGWDDTPGFRRWPRARRALRPDLRRRRRGVIGDFGLVRAAPPGDEIDRVDPAPGRPRWRHRARVLRGRHTSYYRVARVQRLRRPFGGTQNPECAPT